MEKGELNNKELMDYLNRYGAESEPAIVIVDPERRLKYNAKGVGFITDSTVPVMFLMVGEPESFDAEEKAAAEADEAAGGEDDGQTAGE